MKRYTEKHYDENGYYLICSGNCETLNCGDCGILDKIVDRLAAYEDTGLEPEDIKREFNEDAVLKLAGQVLSVTPDRLRELAQADRMIGKTVYYPYAGKVLEKRVSHFIIYDERRANLPPKDNWFCVGHDMSETFDFEDIGKTIFLTREEAEAALRREQE